MQRFELVRNQISANQLFEMTHILAVTPAFFLEVLDKPYDTHQRALGGDATKTTSTFTRTHETLFRAKTHVFVNTLANSPPATRAAV